MSLPGLLLDGERNDASEEQSNDEQLVSHFSIETRIKTLLKSQLEPLIKPALEDIIHGLVKDGTVATKGLWTSMNRNSEDKIQPRNLKLRFVKEIPGEIFTGKKIVDEINLVESLTGEVVKSGPVASAKVEIVVLEGDFGGTNGDDWTLEEFESKIVKEMHGKKSPLVRNELNLKEGIGLVSEVSFTHNASSVKNSKYRLGAKVVDHFDGIKVKEAKTEPFTLKDFRSTYRKKHESLSLHDEVWRVKGIAKYGPFCQRLIKAKVETVQDFLVQLSLDPQGLQQMHNRGHKRWMEIEKHAKNNCRIDKKVYLYPSLSSEQRTRVVFNVVGQMLGILLELQYVPINKLSQAQKADAHKSVVSAFNHWEDVDALDDESALNDLNPLNSIAVESPSGYNTSNPKTVDCDIDAPVTTSDPVSSMGEMPIGLVDFGEDPDIQFISDPVTTSDPVSSMGEMPIDLVDFGEELSIQLISDVMNMMNKWNAEEPHANEKGDAREVLSAEEPHANEKGDASEVLSAGEPHAKQKGDAGKDAMKRWKAVSGVWSSIMVLTRKRVVATEEIHVWKKMKHC